VLPAQLQLGVALLHVPKQPAASLAAPVRRVTLPPTGPTWELALVPVAENPRLDPPPASIWPAFCTPRARDFGSQRAGRMKRRVVFRIVFRIVLVFRTPNAPT
jgi:hypothetical protein